MLCPELVDRDTPDTRRGGRGCPRKSKQVPGRDLSAAGNKDSAFHCLRQLVREQEALSMQNERKPTSCKEHATPQCSVHLMACVRGQPGKGCLYGPRGGH